MTKTDNNFEEFDSKIERFLCNQMTKKEEDAFRQELDTSSELKGRANILALMIKAMQNINMERNEKIISGIKGMDESSFRYSLGFKRKVRIPLVRKIIVYTAMAACFIGICFFALQYNIQSKYEQLGNSTEYLAYHSILQDDMSGHSRGEINKEDLKLLSDLFSNVESGNMLKENIKELHRYYNQSLDENSIYSDYKDDICWNLAIAYLKIGKGKEAKKYLEEILKSNEDMPSISKPVKDLLDKINSIKSL